MILLITISKLILNYNFTKTAFTCYISSLDFNFKLTKSYYRSIYSYVKCIYSKISKYQNYLLYVQTKSCYNNIQLQAPNVNN